MASSVFKEENRSLGPGALEASPGDHTHDGITSKAFAWQSYTPNWTATTVNPSLGNGTITGRYQRIGNLYNTRIHLVIGSTTTFGTGSWFFSPPVNIPNSTFPASVTYCVGHGSAKDDSASAVYTIIVMYRDVTRLLPASHGSLGLSSTVPFSWATGDVLSLFVTFEGL